MNLQLFINIVIIGCVGLLCIILIAVRCYLSCRNRSEIDTIRSINQLYAPEIDFKQQQIVWRTSSQNSNLKNQQCSICLDKNVNTLTSCHHTFHLNCLIQWKRRMKALCPYCKGTNLEKIVFYCHKCKTSNFYYNFQPPVVQQRIHMIPKFFLQFSNTTSQRKLRCPSCKSTQSQTNSQQCKTKNCNRVFKQSHKQNSEHQSNHTSNRVSRDRATVNIQLISNANTNDIIRSSQHLTLVSEQIGPQTGQRLLIKMDD